MKYGTIQGCTTNKNYYFVVACIKIVSYWSTNQACGIINQGNTVLSNFHGRRTSYRTIKTLANLANYSNSLSYFTNFHYLHNISYVNELQFAKVFFCQTSYSPYSPNFYCQSVLLYSNYSMHMYYAKNYSSIITSPLSSSFG